jgi:hypothetical protein
MSWWSHKKPSNKILRGYKMIEQLKEIINETGKQRTIRTIPNELKISFTNVVKEIDSKNLTSKTFYNFCETYFNVEKRRDHQFFLPDEKSIFHKFMEETTKLVRSTNLKGRVAK